ncbi:hypothetical protein BJ165DRAFT_1410798 [Panaeolus papilionaceus]|nr:hypothetical protein BJ165DRAFT_1410798 [Panaeolus papilionaceus]
MTGMGKRRDLERMHVCGRDGENVKSGLQVQREPFFNSSRKALHPIILLFVSTADFRHYTSVNPSSFPRHMSPFNREIPLSPTECWSARDNLLFAVTGCGDSWMGAVVAVPPEGVMYGEVLRGWRKGEKQVYEMYRK